MKALDLSFSAASIAWCQAQRAAGWALLIQDLWTGVSTPSPARANLANAWQAGMLTAGYTVVNNLSGVTAINKAATAAGPEWAHLAFVSVDVEVATTAAIVREAVDGLRAQGKKVCIYTGGWFWNNFNLTGHDFTDVPCWLADYDGNPALDTAPLAKLGPVIGKQYKNSHSLGGVTVDANTFSASFIQEVSDMPFLIHNAAGTYWEMCPGGFKKAIVFPALQAYAAAAEQGFPRVTDVKLADTIINQIPDWPLETMLLEPGSGATLHKRLDGFDVQTRASFKEVMAAIAALPVKDVAAIAKAVNDELARRQQE